MSSKRLGLKLFKYDAMSLMRSLSGLYVVLFLAALLTRATSGLSGNWVAEFVKGFSSTLFMTVVVALIVNNFMRLMVRVRANMYGTESYLTHALPVKTRTIWLAWWAVGLISMVVSCVMAVAAGFVAYADFGAYIAEHIEPIAQMLEVEPALLLLQLGMVLVLELWTFVTVGMLAIVLGQKANNHQGVWSVLYAMVIYGVIQAVIIGAMYLMALNNDQLMAVFKDAPITNFNTLSSVLTLATIFYSLAIVAMGGVAVKSLGRGVNVE